MPLKKSLGLLVVCIALAVIAAACGADGDVVSGDTSTSVPVVTTTTTSERSGIDLTALPLGDGKLSTAPEAGSVYSCQTTFNGPGAFADGPWIQGDTYDLTTKATVDGAVSWDGVFEIVLEGDERVFTANLLPDHPTGEYPVAADDDAANYDRNPNSISEQDVSFRLPANPTMASEPSCVGLGAIGFLLTGSVFFNALDAQGLDAVAHEIQDACQGHPEMTGVYHYHNVSMCVGDAASRHSAPVGYVLDGFAIYGYAGEEGEDMTNAHLDECHGHAHDVDWDDATLELYHYHATSEYPYMVGCYRGSPITIN